MKKSIILLALILTSCATKKVTDTETEIKTDSNSVVKIDATKYSENFTLEPINLEKPILINGKEYYNTKATFNNTTERIIYKDSTSKKVDLKQEKREKEKDYTQVIESVSNRLFWLILILALVIMVSNYIKKKVSI